jgi:cytochrome c-type biogenesis protein CcmH
MKQDITALRQQLQQLQARLAAGDIDEAAYAAAKAPLERQLLDSVLAEGSAAPAPRPGFKLLAVLAVGVIGLAVAGYSYTGAPGATVLAGSGAAPAAAAGDPQAERAQFAAAVEQLAQRLANEPDNHEGWAMLARSYARLDQHMMALPAFEKAGPLLETDAALVADYADTLAVLNDRSLQGAPSQWIEKALKINPNHPKSLALAGTAAFERRDFAVAVQHWEKLVSLSPADADFVPQLQASIAEARREGGLPPAAPAASAAAGTAPATTQAAAPAAAGGARLQGSVRLSPALAQQAAPEDSVFVFARAAEGPRMPLAIMRVQVKDLPFQFTLDDSQAMAPELQLSKFQKVVVSARISKSGQALPAAGDLLGQSGPVDNTATGVAIEINEVVKN